MNQILQLGKPLGLSILATRGQRLSLERKKRPLGFPLQSLLPSYLLSLDPQGFPPSSLNLLALVLASAC